jgi:hypothetical protein
LFGERHTRIPVLAVMSINGFSFGSSDRLLSTMILFGVNVPPSIPVASLDDDLDDLLAIGVDIDAALSVHVVVRIPIFRKTG